MATTTGKASERRASEATISGRYSRAERAYARRVARSTEKARGGGSARQRKYAREAWRALASSEEIAEALIEGIEDPGSFTAGDGEYDVDSWDVEAV